MTCGWTVQELMRRIIRKEQLAVRYAGPFGGASQAWDGSDVVVLLAGGIAVSISVIPLTCNSTLEAVMRRVADTLLAIGSTKTMFDLSTRYSRPFPSAASPTSSSPPHPCMLI